jgi:hypothetical protein
MHIRAAETRDAEGVANPVNTAFRPERFFVDQDRTNPDKVRALVETGKFLLPEDSGSRVGCVYVELRGERGYFGLLSVDPGRQRSGPRVALDSGGGRRLPLGWLPAHGSHGGESANRAASDVSLPGLL